MNDPPNPPQAPHASESLIRRTGRLRWQFVVLLVASLVIVGAAIYMLIPKGSIAGVAAPRSVSLVENQIYTEAVIGEPAWVNPLLAVSQADRDLVALVFSGLTRLDKYGEPIPDLAESWEVSEDGLTYLFHLRSDVTWHDGQRFSANDVAFTMSLLRDPAFPGPADLAAFWRTVETYADDDRTVRFVLTQPLASFPEYAGIGILPAHLLEGIPVARLPDDPFNLQPVGTGRLRWESMQQDSEGVVVSLRPYAQFYDLERTVRLDGLMLRFYSDGGRAFRALGSQAQGFGGLSEAQLDAALSSAGLALYTSRLPIYGAIIFNQQNAARLPFFQDETVRLALLVALNRDQIVAEALGRSALVADSTILPGTWAYHPALTPPAYDTARATQLLDEAGWVLQGSARARDGLPLAFNLLVEDDPVARQIGEAVRQQWAAIGVTVTVQALEAPELLRRIESPATDDTGRDFEAAFVEFSQGRFADPDPYPFWHESQAAEGQNYSGFVDRDISEALEIARSDPNGVRRAELYRSYQQWFLDRAAAILLYNPVYHYAVSCQVAGVQMAILVDPSDRFRNLHEWRILPPETAGQACP